ncbi:hypothetical protein KAR91_82520, partial [Candidatus Pacearchaeota archaeon]|nr:hypothetical protein [Candidatus Pacearchaeota archaeon]
NKDGKFLLIYFVVMVILLIFAAYSYADVTLKWNPPTTNADGSPLTDLAGFKIYEVADGNYTEIADIPADTTTATITMGSGDRCFVGTAHDTSGNESIYSNEVCKDTMPPKTYILIIN